MSFIHYLFVGHFEREDGHVKFAKGADGAYRPVVRVPLDPGEFPADGSAWLADGYLVCDKYTKNEREVAFIARLVERTGCDLYDAAAHADITVTEWLTITPAGTRG